MRFIISGSDIPKCLAIHIVLQEKYRGDEKMWLETTSDVGYRNRLQALVAALWILSGLQSDSFLL